MPHRQPEEVWGKWLTSKMAFHWSNLQEDWNKSGRFQLHALSDSCQTERNVFSGETDWVWVHSSHWYVMAWALLGGYRRRIVPHTFDGEAGHFGKLLFRSPLRSLPYRNGCFFLAMFDCWEVTFLGNSTTEGFGGMACVLVCAGVWGG